MWYYARGEEQIGPLDEQTFVQLAAEGTIGPDTLVWREGMADWAPYATQQPKSAEAPQVEGGVHCVECGSYLASDEAIMFEGQAVCAACKPLYFQRLREGGTGAGQMVFASVAKRFGALILDSAILYLLIILIMIAFVLVIGFASGGEITDDAAGLIGIAYFVVFGGGFVFYMIWFVGRFGATPGKMAVGIKIVRGDGAPVSYTRAFGRMLAHQLSGMILYLGYVIALFDDERRGLHDMICDTRVIDAR